MSDSICLYQSVSVTILTVIPHIIIIGTIHCNGPFTATSGEIHCHAVMVHINSILDLHFLVYKLNKTHKEFYHR